jgi:hypothetical protein
MRRNYGKIGHPQTGQVSSVKYHLIKQENGELLTNRWLSNLYPSRNATTYAKEWSKTYMLNLVPKIRGNWLTWGRNKMDLNNRKNTNSDEEKCTKLRSKLKNNGGFYMPCEFFSFSRHCVDYVTDKTHTCQPMLINTSEFLTYKLYSSGDPSLP